MANGITTKTRVQDLGKPRVIIIGGGFGGLAAARALHQQSPAAAFHFLSGEGAKLDSRAMWCRVKAETEQALAPFGAVCWRPGLIDGMGSTILPNLHDNDGFYVAVLRRH